MKIILVGYMASGKSTIGILLARKFDIPFIDLDQYIEAKENLSIKKIFSTKGEIYFRKQESIYLKEILDSNTNGVLSLGGGTPCYGNNMQLILNTSDAKSVYLKASIVTLVERLQLNQEKRPLIAELDNENLVEYVGKHLFERALFYEQSEVKIKTDYKEKREIVNEIEMLLY